MKKEFVYDAESDSFKLGCAQLRAHDEVEIFYQGPWMSQKSGAVLQWEHIPQLITWLVQQWAAHNAAERDKRA